MPFFIYNERRLETVAFSIHKYPENTLKELGKFSLENQDKSSILKKELGVEPIITSYEHGAYKFEYNLADYTMLTVCGEYSGMPDFVWFLNTKPVTNNELCYNGISVSTLFELSYDDVLSIYGTPSINPSASPEIYGGENYLYETLHFPSQDITYKFSRENGKILSIQSLNKDYVTVNGARLSENPNEFSKALGEPIMSDTYNGSSGSLYVLSNISMEVISDGDATPVRININSSENKVPYNVENLVSIIGSGSESVYYALGIPTEGTSLRENTSYSETEYYIYDNDLCVFFNSYDPISVDEITVSPQNAEKNGETLDKTRDELVDILGVPDYEGYYTHVLACLDENNGIIGKVEFIKAAYTDAEVDQLINRTGEGLVVIHS